MRQFIESTQTPTVDNGIPIMEHQHQETIIPGTSKVKSNSNHHIHSNGTIPKSLQLENGIIPQSTFTTDNILKNGIEFTEVKIPVPWGHISGKMYGNPTNPPVLGVHGWMDNAGTFDRLIPMLAKEFLFLTVDLPGHGRSSHLPPGMSYHFADFIVSLRRITNHFSWSKFTWLGHSMGAALGSIYAASFPNQVERLIMIDLVKPLTSKTGSDTAPLISNAVDEFLALEKKIQPNPPSYSYQEALERMMNGISGKRSSEAAKALMIRGSRETGDKFWFSRDLRLRSPSLLRLSPEQCTAILGNIRSPTMILKASDSPWYEPRDLCMEAIDIYRQNCQVFEYVEINGNHFMHLEEPEKIAEHINVFLRRNFD